MAKYLIEDNTLTEIADGIRTVLGESNLMGTSEMVTNIDTVQNEVNTQADLIAQIKNGLGGKASGSGSGGDVQMKTGNITIGRSFTATECGFSPDVVIFEATQYTFGDTVTSGVAWIDDEADKYAIFVGISTIAVTSHHSIMTVRKDASGFSAKAILYDTSSLPINGTIDQTVKYTAIKYTA